MKGDSGMWSGRPGCWRLLPRDPRRTRLTATPSPNHSANAQLEQADASGCESSKIGVPFCRDQLSLPFVTKNYVCGRWILPNCKKCTLGRPFCTYRMAPNIPHPLKLKCMERGGGREFFIHFHPPSETGIFVWTFFVKLRNYLKRWGGAPHTFSAFGFKSLFRKRWGGGFIHWFCKAMNLWCSWNFPGNLTK